MVERIRRGKPKLLWSQENEKPVTLEDLKMLSMPRLIYRSVAPVHQKNRCERVGNELATRQMQYKRVLRVLVSCNL